MKLKEIIPNFLNSLTTKVGGFSARKLSAFAAMTMIGIIDIKWLRADQWVYISEILGLHFAFVLACLGIVAWEKIKTKNETTNSDTTIN